MLHFISFVTAHSSVVFAAAAAVVVVVVVVVNDVAFCSIVWSSGVQRVLP